MASRRKCPNCGKPERSQTEDSFFCKKCGVLMDPTDPNNPPYSTSGIKQETEKHVEEEKEKKGNVTMKRSSINGLLIATTILAGITIGFLLMFLLKSCDNDRYDNNETNAIESTTTETTAETNTIEIDGEAIETFVSNPIPNDGKYLLHDSNGNEIIKDLSKAIGFVPDENLLVSDLESKELGQESAVTTRDFQKYLNEKRDGLEPLAGFTDGTNDYNQYYLHQSGPQVPAYSWMIHTGLYVEMPGIGRVIGGEGRAVLVLIINCTDNIYRFPTNSVTVIAGFQGWGRIWNGESKEVVETEKRITNHYLTRLGEGVPKTGFIGQTDQGEENASTVTVITVEMVEGQFRLIRAETVNAIK